MRAAALQQFRMDTFLIKSLPVRCMRTRCSEREYGAVNLEKCRRFVQRVKRDRSLKRARVVTAT